jgi:hypothetical protein
MIQFSKVVVNFLIISDPGVLRLGSNGELQNQMSVSISSEWLLLSALLPHPALPAPRSNALQSLHLLAILMQLFGAVARTFLIENSSTVRLSFKQLHSFPAAAHCCHSIAS